jgi:hypothetical protein
MSRILRRPMFRGGRVSSYGTGIAAPLVPGYQGGGQIGGGIIYGKPMADGRYGFKEPEKVGMELLEENIPNFGEAELKKIRQEREYAEEPTKLTDEYIREQFEDAVLKNKRNVETGGMSETDLAYGMQIAMPISGDDADFYKAIGQDKEGTYELWREGKIPGIDDTNWNKAQAEQEKKYDVNLSDRPDKETIDPKDKLIADLKAQLIAKNEGAVEPEVDAKTAVAENKELFRDLLGYDKAKGQDISDMLLGFAGAEGDDTWSKAKSFFKDEAKRPGRAQKISDAAGTLAIQDYIAGKRSKEQIDRLKGIEDYKKTTLLQTKIPQKTDTLEEASFKLTAAGISPTSPKGLKFLIGINDDTPMADNVVSVSGIKIEELTDPGKTNKIIKKLKPGYNILDDDGVKRIILYDGSGTAAGIDVMTVSEFWSKK